jgi:hypothetical protein
LTTDLHPTFRRLAAGEIEDRGFHFSTLDSSTSYGSSAQAFRQAHCVGARSSM